MNRGRLSPNMNGDHDSNQRLGNVSLTEIGERLSSWRDYTIIPAVFILSVFADPTAKTATIGTLLILLGAAARIYTLAFMVEPSPEHVNAEHLVTTGPFAIIRNPLYLANMLITFGVVVYANNYVGVLLLIYFAFQYHCIIKYEESTLLAKFGDDYQRYMERVPPWIPLKTPILDDFPLPPNLRSAFISEKKSLAAIAIIVFLLMLAGK